MSANNADAPMVGVLESSATSRIRMLVALGLAVALLNVVDRSVVNILAEPIKRELGLSDTQLGLLTGFSFALFYSLMGVPIARYADRPRSDRPLIIAACMSLWSVMTVAAGMVSSFTQLLLARALVAVGESGSGPAIVTLVNHYVTPATRTRAFAIYGLGPSLGTLLGIMVGGWLVDLIGWRMTFVAVGAPGLALTALVLWLMPEPRRAARGAMVSGGPPAPSLIDNARVMLRSPSLRWLVGAAGFTGLLTFGLPAWMGVYMIRVMGLTPTKTGLS